MHETKTVVLGGLLACMAVLFQILPLFLSEAFAVLTMFSAIPVYIICRINPRIGISSTMVSFFLISLFTTHEALFFICTNGPIGASLGCCSHITSNKKFIIPISSFILSCTLSIMNFIIGIPIFGAPLPGTLVIQILVILVFSFIYSCIYLHLSNFIFKELAKVINV